MDPEVPRSSRGGGTTKIKFVGLSYIKKIDEIHKKLNLTFIFVLKACFPNQSIECIMIWYLKTDSWVNYYLDTHEKILLNHSQKILTGDEETLAALSRMTLLNGIAAIIIGSTHAGSMGEHLISHYIDMFMGDEHPGSLHGEQVGVATLLLSRMQNDILNNSHPPQFLEINYDLIIFENIFGMSILT